MAQFRVSIAGIMLVVALAAANLAVARALGTVPFEGTRLALVVALPMADLAMLCLAISASRLACRGEAALAPITFALVGAAAILALLTFATVAPWSFYDYLELTTGLYRGPRQHATELRLLGLVATGTMASVVVYGAIAVPLLVPAVLGGYMTRGYRVRIFRGTGAAGG